VKVNILLFTLILSSFNQLYAMSRSLDCAALLEKFTEAKELADFNEIKTWRFAKLSNEQKMLKDLQIIDLYNGIITYNHGTVQDYRLIEPSPNFNHDYNLRSTKFYEFQFLEKLHDLTFIDTRELDLTEYGYLVNLDRTINDFFKKQSIVEDLNIEPLYNDLITALLIEKRISAKTRIDAVIFVTYRLLLKEPNDKFLDDTYRLLNNLNLNNESYFLSHIFPRTLFSSPEEEMTPLQFAYFLKFEFIRTIVNKGIKKTPIELIWDVENSLTKKGRVLSPNLMATLLLIFMDETSQYLGTRVAQADWRLNGITLLEKIVAKKQYQKGASTNKYVMKELRDRMIAFVKLVNGGTISSEEMKEVDTLISKI